MSTQYSTRTYTWQDLADETVTELYTEAGYFDGDNYILATAALGWEEWTQWTGNGVTIDGSTGFANLVVTSGVIDLGSIKKFVVTASVDSNGSNAVVIQVSDNNSSYTNKGVSDTLSGRYVKFQITVTNGSATAQLNSFEGEVIEDTIQETFKALDISGLTGSVAARTLAITRNYNQILGITANAPDGFQIVTVASGSAPTVKGVNLDTWGKVDADCTADITVSGLPAMAADSNGNIVLNP